MTGPIRDDQDMHTVVRSWLAEGHEPTPDRGRQIGRIMGRVDEVRQRRRFWPLNPFGRRAVHGEATGAEGVFAPAQGRTAALVPGRALTAVALVVLVTASLVWISSQPVEQQLVPGAWSDDSADQAMFEDLATLWVGKETDLVTTQEVYAEDAVHSVLWLDEEEVISGSDAIWSRMRVSDSVDWTRTQSLRLPDDLPRTHRYLLIADPEGTTSLDGTACVLWVEDARIARHDCILPLSSGGALPPMVAPDAASSAEREALATGLVEATGLGNRELLQQVVSTDIAHHVLSANQTYTLQGPDEYWSVLGRGTPRVMMDADLPAPEGELRWANFSSVGGGSLCVFWARDGLITRHDCIVPSATIVPHDLTDAGRSAGE